MGCSSRRLLNQSTHSEGRELDGLERAPWSASMDDLGLVETVDRFGEGVVVAVAHAAYRRLDARFGQALGVLIETYWLPRSL